LRRLVGVLALALFALAGVHATTQARAGEDTRAGGSESSSKPKRLIFFLSDGMGPAHLTLARDAGACGALTLDEHLVGASRTRSTNSLVTDSAAGATAYATGHRTYNHVVGEVPVGDPNDVDFTSGSASASGATGPEPGPVTGPVRPAGTIVEGAQLAGMRTGVVTTTRVTHATPASFSSHVADRNDETEIALEQVYTLDLNVILGGGAAQFLSKDAFPERSARNDTRDLMADAKHRGYAIAFNAGDLNEAVAEIVRSGGIKGEETDQGGGDASENSSTAAPFANRQFGPRVLGLFADSHLAYEIDAHEDSLAGFANGATPSRGDAEAPSLVAMLDAALAVLDAKFAEHENDEGFFLLVEAGRIDHGAHANDAGAVIGEMCAYDRAFKRAVEYVAARNDALVVATSDHDTGGVSVGCCDAYEVDVAKLNALKKSAEFVANDIVTEMLKLDGVVFDRSATAANATVENAVRAIAIASLAAAGRDVSDASDSVGDADVSAIVAAAIEAIAAGDSVTHTYEGYELQNKIGEVMNRANKVGWTSRAHTGVDVPLFAFGVGAEAFRGSHDNFRVGQMMIDALGVDPVEGYKVFRDRLSIVDADETPP
jgi:alkaline phosphatase